MPSAVMKINIDGKVNHYNSIGSQDTGQELYTTLAAIFAEELRVWLEDITLFAAGTDIYPAKITPIQVVRAHNCGKIINPIGGQGGEVIYQCPVCLKFWKDTFNLVKHILRIGDHV